MSNILGNQEHRTSKVDTEKWKEHAEYYNTLRNTKNKTETQTPIETQTLEKILQYDSEGRPKIELTPLRDTAVNTKTKKEYDMLMQICESAGWNWSTRSGEATRLDYWKSHQTCINHEQGLFYSPFGHYREKGYNILSFEKFQEIQHITPQMLKELNDWYDTHRPNRASKG